MSPPETTEIGAAGSGREPAPAPIGAGRRVFGVIFLVLGVGLTFLSGLCTAGMTVGDMFSGSGGGGDVNLSGIQFIVGGPFIVVGALMWWGGRRMLKARKAPAEVPPAEGPR